MSTSFFGLLRYEISGAINLNVVCLLPTRGGAKLEPYEAGILIEQHYAINMEPN